MGAIELNPKLKVNRVQRKKRKKKGKKDRYRNQIRGRIFFIRRGGCKGPKIFRYIESLIK